MLEGFLVIIGHKTTHFLALFFAPLAQSTSCATACLEASAWALSAAAVAFLALPATFLVFSVFVPPMVTGRWEMGRGRVLGEEPLQCM